MPTWYNDSMKTYCRYIDCTKHSYRLHKKGRDTSLGNRYVYALRDPETYAVRYVGVSLNPIRRLVQHIQAAVQRRERTAKDEWILSCQPIIEILEYVGLAAHNCYKAEQWWIQEMYRRGEPLLNGGARTKPVV